MEQVWVNTRNTKILQDATATTTWHTIGVASDGTMTAYTTLAALQATTDKPLLVYMPNSEIYQWVRLRSIATGGTSDGSPFLFGFGPTKPGDTTADLVSGSGQTVTFGNVGDFLWIRKTVSTDLIVVHVGY